MSCMGGSTRFETDPAGQIDKSFSHAAAEAVRRRATSGVQERKLCGGIRTWKMFLRPAVARASLIAGHVRNSSTLTSPIKLSSIPAPHTGVISILSLNRPKARNAISRDLLSELSGVVEGLHAEAGKGSTRALIIASGSDDAFCAGADLKERLDFSPEEYVEPRVIIIHQQTNSSLEQQPSSSRSAAPSAVFLLCPSRPSQLSHPQPLVEVSSWHYALPSASWRPLLCSASLKPG